YREVLRLTAQFSRPQIDWLLKNFDLLNPKVADWCLTVLKFYRCYHDNEELLDGIFKNTDGDKPTPYRRLNELLERYGYLSLIEKFLARIAPIDHVHLFYPILDTLIKASMNTPNQSKETALDKAIACYKEHLSKIPSDAIDPYLSFLIPLLSTAPTLNDQLEVIRALFPAHLKGKLLDQWIFEASKELFERKHSDEYQLIIEVCQKTKDKETALTTLTLIDQIAKGSKNRRREIIKASLGVIHSETRIRVLQFLTDHPKLDVELIPLLGFLEEENWETIAKSVDSGIQMVSLISKTLQLTVEAHAAEWSKEECQAFYQAVKCLKNKNIGLRILLKAMAKNQKMIALLDGSESNSFAFYSTLKPEDYPEELSIEIAREISKSFSKNPNSEEGRATTLYELKKLCHHRTFFQLLINHLIKNPKFVFTLSDSDSEHLLVAIKTHGHHCNPKQLDWIFKYFDHFSLGREIATYATIHPQLVEEKCSEEEIFEFIKTPEGIAFIQRFRHAIWKSYPKIQQAIEGLYPLSEPQHLAYYTFAFTFSRETDAVLYHIKGPQSILKSQSCDILLKFAEFLRREGLPKHSNAELNIAFIDSPVIDAGAARRDFIRQLLFESLKAMRVMPEGSEKQKLYTALGDVLHFLYRSKDPLPMGNLIDKEVFELILCFTPEETAHSYRSLALCPTRRLELIDGLQAYFGDLDKRGENSTFNNLKKLMKWQGGEEGREAAIAAIKQYYAETLCEEPPPLIDTEGKWIHPQSLRTLKREIFDSYTQQIGLDKKLRPIFSMARKLSQLAKEGVTAKELRRKIQGHLDVEALQEAIKFTSVPKAIVDLIRNWIDANRDNHDVLELFVCFLWGSSSLPAENWKECIKIACVERGSEMRVSAQSCFGQMNLSMPHIPEEQTRLEVAVRWVLGLCEKLDYETLATFDEG
ncbi:MAG: hypothetical protein KDK40_00790, partial [Chlamydiia bacterium]|nr:hypothetical protein [Chlamydiia bacterium]